MIDGTLPGYWDATTTGFTVTNGTVAKIISDATYAKVATAVSGETALPGEASVRQRILTGGSRIVDGLVTSTDAAAKSLLIYKGSEITRYTNMGTVTTTATTNSTVTRSSGSFITDGWKVGDSVMLFGCTSAANDGKITQITNVTATTITVNGTTAISVAETQGATFRMFNVSLYGRIAIPANSGNSDTIPPVKLFNHANDVRNDTSGIYFGDDGVLIGALVAAASALPATIGVTVHRGLY